MSFSGITSRSAGSSSIGPTTEDLLKSMAAGTTQSPVAQAENGQRLLWRSCST